MRPVLFDQSDKKVFVWDIDRKLELLKIHQNCHRRIAVLLWSLRMVRNGDKLHLNLYAQIPIHAYFWMATKTIARKKLKSLKYTDHFRYVCVCIFRFSINFVALLYNYHLVFAFNRIHSHSLPLFSPPLPSLDTHKLIYKYIYSLATSRLRFKCSRKAIVFICTVLLTLSHIRSAFLWHAIYFWLWLLSLCLVYFALVWNKLSHLLGTFFQFDYVFSNAFTLSQAIFAIPLHTHTHTHTQNAPHCGMCSPLHTCVCAHTMIVQWTCVLYVDRCLFLIFTFPCSTLLIQCIKLTSKISKVSSAHTRTLPMQSNILISDKHFVCHFVFLYDSIRCLKCDNWATKFVTPSYHLSTMFQWF